MFRNASSIAQSQGIWGMARRSVAFAYRKAVRPWLPGQPVQLAGIPVCYDRKWGDRIFLSSWLSEMRLDDNPDYEAALVAGLREAIRPGDRVVVVGGGIGVTAVVAALQAGPTGSVRCFEGSKQGARRVEKTASRNRVSNLSVQHAVVAKSVAVWGKGRDVGEVLPAKKLPPCDVLQLDCEGAEVEILGELTIQPRVILVETHGCYGAPTEVIASLLEERGYIVSHRGVAEPSFAELCTESDIQVLLGTFGAR